MIPNHASHTRPLTLILWCFLARTPVNASLLSSEWRSFQEPKLRWSSTRSFYREQYSVRVGTSVAIDTVQCWVYMYMQWMGTLTGCHHRVSYRRGYPPPSFNSPSPPQVCIHVLVVWLSVHSWQFYILTGYWNNSWLFFFSKLFWSLFLFSPLLQNPVWHPDS